MYYEFGLGVREDYQKAREWYEKSVAQGDSGGQCRFGRLYFNGHSVRQDYLQAKEWYGKSCDNGLQLGCDGYKRLNN